MPNPREGAARNEARRSAVPEFELADTLGNGRSSVREAVKALQSLGIVEIRRGDGLYVRAVN